MNLSVFDLDHTLLHVNSSFRFGAYLYKKKFFRFFSFLSCMIYYACHKICGMSLYKVHQRIFFSIFNGRSLKEIQKHVTVFLDQELKRMLSQSVLKRLKDAQDRGDYTLILSSSPDFLVKPIAEALGVQDWMATVYSEDKKGNLVRVSKILEGKGKAEYIISLAEKLGLKKSSIIAYSDSYLDLPMLKVAGHPIGVDPDFQLKRICQKNGWEILY